MSSLPPEVEVPLPLGLGLVAAPVVGESARGVAELAAGSPVTAPRPLGAPPCASADPATNKLTIIAANTARMRLSMFLRANHRACALFRRASI
ncbi:hypothetical protein FXV83_22705 [Bradyrhizobium hipponense]|uniref:Uncharacterized protein n=1 Tax=Bradyrhizobium hipponense TaxID=2605638 RepID=A0A5S4YJA0_9BRAD|nr:hypothetical protein FXV83_22705 [Bradyrhizobium hipponense]